MGTDESRTAGNQYSHLGILLSGCWRRPPTPCASRCKSRRHLARQLAFRCLQGFFRVKVTVEAGDILDRDERRITVPQYRRLAETGTRFDRTRLLAGFGLLMPALWFALVAAAVWPLADGPVADSWIYLRAVKRLNVGILSMPGFAAAIPAAQLVYGLGWSRLFGLDYLSLDYSVMVLGVSGGMLFYSLARRCGAAVPCALLATALLIVNPCYLFLSFSFMSDVPFVVLLIAAHLMFAAAQHAHRNARLWACAILLTAAFMVRPFALAAVAGCAAVTWFAPRPRRPLRERMRELLPFLNATAVCVLFWLWLTAAMPAPWMVAPLLYLGLVLSPLALPHLVSSRWRRGLAIAAALAVATLPVLLTDPGASSIPELSCCGGWNNVLVLRGPLRFAWTNLPLRLAILGISILGVAGIVLAAMEIKAAEAGFLAVIVSAAIYWAGTVPLWLYNDRYYLVMLPAGCLLLAAAPRPRTMAARGATLAMLAAMGWLAAAGVYDQQRGLDAVMAARDALLAQGVARTEIDAGYPLNGSDLYRDPAPGRQETFALEAGIPLITSSEPKLYTIAAAPLAGSAILRRFKWPGVFGLGHRTLYVLKTPPAAVSSRPPDSLGVKHPIAQRADLSTHPGLVLIAVRLSVMALIALSPLLAVAVRLLRS